MKLLLKGIALLTREILWRKNGWYRLPAPSIFATFALFTTEQGGIGGSLATLKQRCGERKLFYADPRHPVYRTHPAQSTHFTDDVIMNGYASPPPFILTSHGKLQKDATWLSFACLVASLFVIGRIAMKLKSLRNF